MILDKQNDLQYLYFSSYMQRISICYGYPGVKIINIIEALFISFQKDPFYISDTQYAFSPTPNIDWIVGIIPCPFLYMKIFRWEIYQDSVSYYRDIHCPISSLIYMEIDCSFINDELSPCGNMHVYNWI